MRRNTYRALSRLLATAICLWCLSAVACAQADNSCDRAKGRLPNEDACGPAALLNANSTDSFSVSRYVIQGIVLDDHGGPVEAAALHIGRQVAYTNSSGHFLVRLSKRASFPFSLAPEEFITNGVYEVVSAPSEVHSESEDNATDVQVVVRRVPPPQARLYNQ